MENNWYSSCVFGEERNEVNIVHLGGLVIDYGRIEMWVDVDAILMLTPKFITPEFQFKLSFAFCVNALALKGVCTR